MLVAIIYIYMYIYIIKKNSPENSRCTSVNIGEYETE